MESAAIMSAAQMHIGPFPSKGREDLEKDAVEGQFDKMQLRLQLAYQLIDAIEEHAQTLDRCA